MNKSQIIQTVKSYLAGSKTNAYGKTIQQKVALFKKTIELAKRSSEKIVLVNMPIFDSKMKTFKDEEYQVFLSFFSDYAKNHRNFYFLDLNQQQIISNPNLFSDPLHINVEGQTKVFAALVQFLSSNNMISKRRSLP